MNLAETARFQLVPASQLTKLRYRSKPKVHSTVRWNLLYSAKDSQQFPYAGKDSRQVYAACSSDIGMTRSRQQTPGEVSVSCMGPVADVCYSCLKFLSYLPLTLVMPGVMFTSC